MWAFAENYVVGVGFEGDLKVVFQLSHNLLCDKYEVTPRTVRAWAVLGKTLQAVLRASVGSV